MLEKSFHKFNKDFQTNIGELQRKYVALMNGNVPCGYCTSGKYWSELKSLHANHIASSKVFQNIKLLQNSHALEVLDTKKGNTLKEDKLIELTTLFSSEVNSLQGIVQSLQQCLKPMEQKHEIHEKHLACKHCIPSMHFILI